MDRVRSDKKENAFSRYVTRLWKVKVSSTCVVIIIMMMMLVVTTVSCPVQKQIRWTGSNWMPGISVACKCRWIPYLTSSRGYLE